MPKKQRKVCAKQQTKEVVERMEDIFNTSIDEELCYNQDHTEFSTSDLNALKKDSTVVI